jgi:Co/Zn/Cd efflux system component
VSTHPHVGTCTCERSPSLVRKAERGRPIALAVNAGFFAAEIVAGLAAGSSALQADALDFLGDAANYVISLGVAGMALGVRARAALVKGGTLIAFALWALGSSAWRCTARCRRPKSWAWWGSPP